MTDLAVPEVLACGTRPDLLLGSMVDGDDTVPGAHVAACPYCRQVLDDLAPRWRELHAVDGVPATTPAGIERQVLLRIRRLRTALPVELAGPGPGRTTVSEEVVAACLQAEIGGVTGVVSAQVTAHSSALDLAVSVVVDGSRPIPDVDAAVRAEVTAAMDRHFAVPAGRVDIEVAGIAFPA